MMKQKEAVFQAIVNVTGFTGEGACSPTKEQRHQIHSILVEGFKAGKISIEKQYDEAGLKSYVNGLVNNWLRKDKRLNGGTAYVAKNPGSRQGSTDPQIKAMRALLSTLTDESERAEVQRFIDARLQEIKPKQEVAVDFSALPADLAAKFTK
jgi:hypothetical protein